MDRNGARERSEGDPGIRPESRRSRNGRATILTPPFWRHLTGFGDFGAPAGREWTPKARQKSEK